LAACLEGYREAFYLEEQIPDTQAAALCAFNLGHAYKDLAEIRDLALAERWYGRSFELHAREDRTGRAGCFVQLSMVEYERFLDARNARRPPEECIGHLSKAEKYCRQALEMYPTHAVRELGTTHYQLGILYANGGQIDAALRHYRESIRYCDVMQDRFAAGETRRNVANAHSLARAASPTPASGHNRPYAISKLAKMPSNKSSRSSNFWRISNLLAERLHRRRKHIYPNHINQLDPQ
jgi:tetratricopeptide (TPR) repeat protein